MSNMLKRKRITAILLAVFLPLSLAFGANFNSLYRPISLVKQGGIAEINVPTTVFKANGTHINAYYYGKLNSIAKFLRENKNVYVVIPNLSKNQAKTIEKYLTSRGVNAENIFTSKTKPIKEVSKAIPMKSVASSATGGGVRLMEQGNIAEIDVLNITFEFNKAQIKQHYYKRLNDIARYLKKRPKESVVIFGHTDNIGSVLYNQKLSERRARSIENYLIEHGINAKRISTQGFGEQMPVASNKTNIGRSINRRSEVAVIAPLKNKQSYIPRVYLAGYGGYDDWTALGQTDVLAPVFLRNDRNLFVYGQGRYSYDHRKWADNPWTGSLGLGYRQIVKNGAVLGAYVLGDYSRTPGGHNIFMISPGIESLGRNWDFRANWYFPVGKTEWTKTGWADEFGNYDYLHLKGHTRYDAIFTYYEEAGIGTDAEVGRKLFKIHDVLVKGYLDGYYFHMKHNDDIFGGGARVTVEPTTYLKVSVEDSYDNHNHNVVMAGAQVSLYDIFSGESKKVDENNLQRRLYDPIERNFATIASASDVRTTGGPDDPEAKPVIDDGYNPNDNPDHNTPYVENDNAWYFGNGTIDAGDDGDKRHDGDLGTIENPYPNPDFNQDTMNYINTYNAKHGYDHADLYFRPESYNNLPHDSANGNQVQLYNNFTMNGMNPDFKAPENGNTFYGSLKLVSGDTLNNITLKNDTGANPGITIDSVDGVTLNDVQVGTTDSLATGILLNNAANVVIENNSSVDGYVTGISMQGNGSMTMSGGTINASSYGIEANGDGVVDIKGVKIYASDTGINVNKANSVKIEDNTEIHNAATGIKLNNVTGKVEIDNTNIYAPTEAGNTGIDIESSDDVTLNKVNVGDNTSAYTTGMKLNSDGVVDVKGAKIYASDTGISGDSDNSVKIEDNTEIHDAVTGIKLNNDKTVNISDSNIYAGAYDQDATGISITGGGSLIVSDNSDIESIATEGNSYGIKADGKGEMIEVDNSKVHGNASDDKGNTNSGDGYGILVGDNYFKSNDAGKEIKGNHVTINNSTVKGDGSFVLPEDAPDTGYDNSGNGYGVMVGYGSAYYSGTKSPNLSVNSNIVTVEGQSTVTGRGQDDVIHTLTMDKTANDYGNGYGVAVGYAAAILNAQSGANFSISDNKVSIKENSTVEGIGNEYGTEKYHFASGNGIGVLIGYNDIRNSLGSNDDNPSSSYNLSLEKNQLYVDDNAQVRGDATGISNDDGTTNSNGIGILFGHNVESKDTDNPSGYLYHDPRLSGNYISIQGEESKSALIYAKVGSDGAGKAYGLVFGSRYTVDDPEGGDSDNNINVKNAYFYVQAGQKTAFGIITPVNADLGHFFDEGNKSIYFHVEDDAGKDKYKGEAVQISDKTGSLTIHWGDNPVH